MGQGRNAVHLAGAGWRVTGFDLSPAGVAAAEAAATAQGTPIDAVVASADSFDYGVGRWDLIVMTYALVPVAEPAFADRIIGALAPGGLVVVESFAVASDGPSRPVDIDPDALRVAYATLEETEFGLDETVADWTLAPASVVRLAAAAPRLTTQGSPALVRQKSTIAWVVSKWVATGGLPRVVGVGQLWPPLRTVPWT